MRQVQNMCLALLFLGTACKDAADLSEGVTTASKAPPPGFDVDTATPILRTKKIDTKTSPQKTKQFTKKTVEELTRKLPILSEAIIEKALQPMPRARLATMVICFASSVEKTSATLVKAYKGKGWTDIAIQTSGRGNVRRSFSANSKRFHLTASIAIGEQSKCKQPSKVTLTFSERPPGKGMSVPPVAPSMRVFPATGIRKDGGIATRPAKKAPPPNK